MFRRMLQRYSDFLRRLMWGRCGVDQLNLFLMIVSVILCLVGSFLARVNAVCLVIGLGMTFVSYGLLAWYFLRFFSRNLEKRSRENRRFLNLKSRLTDRQSRYFRCPNCRQTVRVPRGRGKICIKCPKCSEKFIKKT